VGGRDRIRSQITQKARNQRILLSSSPASIFTLLENLEEYYAGAALTLQIRLQFPICGYLLDFDKKITKVQFEQIYFHKVLREFYKIL
jgi:hypothetical protein